MKTTPDQSSLTFTLTPHEFLAICGDVAAATASAENGDGFQSPTASAIADSALADIEALSMCDDFAPEVHEAIYRRVQQARAALGVLARHRKQLTTTSSNPSPVTAPTRRGGEGNRRIGS